MASATRPVEMDVLESGAAQSDRLDSSHEAPRAGTRSPGCALHDLPHELLLAVIGWAAPRDAMWSHHGVVRGRLEKALAQSHAQTPQTRRTRARKCRFLAGMIDATARSSGSCLRVALCRRAWAARRGGRASGDVWCSVKEHRGSRAS